MHTVSQTWLKLPEKERYPSGNELGQGSRPRSIIEGDHCKPIQTDRVWQSALSMFGLFRIRSQIRFGLQFKIDELIDVA